MQKEIRFSGLNTSTNGRLSADGAMGEVMNFVPGADGMSIATLPPPQDHGDGNELMCVHHLPDGGVKYIYRRVEGNKCIVSYRSNDLSEELLSIVETYNNGLLGIEALGNTLVLRYEQSIIYLLWREEAKSYRNLGSKPPQANIQFGIRGSFASYPDNNESKQAKPSTWGKYEDTNYESGIDNDGWIVWKDYFYTAYFPCEYNGYEKREPYKSGPFSAESMFKRVLGNDSDSDANGGNTATVVMRLTNLVMGAVNKFISQQGSEKNRFVMPFLVRYAYRMFDGTHIMHSAPVLMMPNSKAPVVWWRADSSIKGVHKSENSYAARSPFIYARVSAVASKLMMRPIKIPGDLINWKDVIQGIDIFVSQPLYTFEQDKPVYGWDKMGDSNTYTLSANWAPYFHDGNIEEYNTAGKTPTYGQRQWYNIQSKVYDYRWYQPRYKFSIKERSEADIAKDVKTCSTFFKISSIDLKDLVWESGERIETASEPSITKMAEVKMEEGILTSLTSQERLDDDYKSHYAKASTCGYIYNNRLNIGNVSELVNAEANMCEVAMPTNFIGYDNGNPYYWRAVVEYIKNGKSVFIKQPNPITFDGYDADFPRYVFVPDADAKRVYLSRYINAKAESQGIGEGEIVGDEHEIVDIGGGYDFAADGNFGTSQGTETIDGVETTMDYDASKVYPWEDPNGEGGNVIITNDDAFTSKKLKTYIIDLDKHEFLNGAVWFKGYNNNSLLANEYDVHDESQDKTTERVNYLNKIYTSNAANPFKFEPANINTIGTGRIMAMRSAVTPVRANQVGQLSMYAFSEDGVWAMKVSGTTGGWSGWEIVNGDVLKDPNSICQMDNAVAYITKQGVKILQGSESACMSSILDGENHGVVEALAWADADKVDEFLGTMVRVEDRFEDYCDGAGLAYDYTNQRLICFNKNYRYYYIYNIASPGWGCALAKIYSAVNDYPSTWINCNDIGKVAELSAKHDDRQKVVGYMLSRAIKFDAPDAFKTITDLIVRGNIGGRILDAVLLLGSRDLINWQVVSATSCRVRAMHGSGFKYFKLLIKGEFPSWAKIDGFTAEVTSKLGNKLR